MKHYLIYRLLTACLAGIASLMIVTTPAHARIGSVFGAVINKNTGERLGGGITLSLDVGIAVITTKTYPDGAYLINAPAGLDYILTVKVPGYESFKKTGIEVSRLGFTPVGVALTPTNMATGLGATCVGCPVPSSQSGGSSQATRSRPNIDITDKMVRRPGTTSNVTSRKYQARSRKQPKPVSLSRAKSLSKHDVIMAACRTAGPVGSARHKQCLMKQILRHYKGRMKR